MARKASCWVRCNLMGAMQVRSARPGKKLHEKRLDYQAGEMEQGAIMLRRLSASVTQLCERGGRT